MDTPTISESKMLIINDSEEDFVGVEYNFAYEGYTDIDKLRCTYIAIAHLMSKTGTKVLIPNIVASYNTMEKY